MQTNRDLSLARLRYQCAREDASHSFALSAQSVCRLGHGLYQRFPLLAGGGAPALFNLTYDEALFDRPARGDLQVAEQQMEQQRIQVDGVRDGVIVRVASAYLELAKVRRESGSFAEGAGQRAENPGLHAQKMEAGFELPIEVTKAQLTAARIEQRMAQLDDADESLADQLRTLLGLGPDQRIEVTAEDIPAAANQTAATWCSRRWHITGD